MKCFLFIYTLTFIIHQPLAQTDSTFANWPRDYFISDHTSINVSYGKSFLIFENDLDNYFQESYNSEFGQVTDCFSLNISAPMSFAGGASPREKVFDSNLGFNFKRSGDFRPDDSTLFKLSSLSFHLAIGKDILFFWKNIDLPVRFGTDFGMSSLIINSKYNRNPFFDLIVQLEPRIILWKIVFSAKADIGLDITSTNWKPKSNGLNDLMSFRNHYKSLVFSIGFALD